MATPQMDRALWRGSDDAEFVHTEVDYIDSLDDQGQDQCPTVHGDSECIWFRVAMMHKLIRQARA